MVFISTPGVDHAPPVLTPMQAARELDVSPATIRRWIAQGVLEGIRVGGRLRIEREALEQVVRPASPESAS